MFRPPGPAPTRNTATSRRPWRAAVALTLLGAAGPAWCQQTLQEEQVIHWAYGAFLGTGWYKLDHNRDVFILRAPLSWSLGEPDPAASGWDRAGITLEAPISLGVHSLDEFSDFIDTDNVGTVSVTPGVRVDWPWNERLLLRGFAHLGYGTALDNEESAWIWDLGLRSRYRMAGRALDWAWVNEVFHVGYDPHAVPASSLGGLMTGAEFRRPLPDSESGLELRWDLSWRWMGDALTFLNQDRSLVTIDDEWQLSASLGRAGRPFRIGFVEFEQFGLSYRFSSDGEFRAITLVFAPLFDR